MESSAASAAKKEKAFAFQDYVRKSSLPEEIKTGLYGGCVQKVEISTARRFWRVCYALQEHVPKMWLDKLAGEICKDIAQLQA
ncbi:MAG: hypothetical protein M1543_00785, partial [Firmicutes bacterium]|nr:hypothetical protein [Bacillota bacterium]